MKMLLKDGKSKVLTFSYDDGVVQDKRLVEIFDCHGLKGTFNINSGLYRPSDTDGSSGRMTKDSCLALYKNSNHEVAVHGFKHLWPAKISSVELLQEILEDRKAIEKDYGVIARGMAYAYGNYNAEVIDILHHCGIVYSRTTKSTHSFSFPENWLELHPTCHHKDNQLMQLAERFVNTFPKNKYPEMFYVWGHSFEFDNDSNWDVMEKFAQYISGHEHIWYATNIEIYDYVSAYNRLQVSVDEKLVHNPSAIDLWVSLNDEAHCIKAGETLNLK